MLFDIAKHYGLYLDREPEYGGREYLEKQDYILMKQKEQIAQQEQNLNELTMKIEDVESLVDEVSELAYDKAVEVVTEAVHAETQKEDVAVIKEYKDWLLKPGRKAPLDVRQYTAARMDKVIEKIMGAAQKIVVKIQQILKKPEIRKMSEMIATANARSIEEIKSFLSRQKETYKVPYEVHPADRPRQCVFCGTSNALDFLPLDRSGNRRFVPVMTHLELAEVHILDDEEEARAYFLQMWAEAMEIYRSGQFKLIFSAGMEKQLKEIQKDFMPEDSIAGIIIAWLDDCKEDYVCSRMIFAEALNQPYDEPKSWQLREINDVMNHQVSDWMPGSQHRFSKYGQQRSWVRKQTGVNGAENMGDGFVKVLEQMELPFKNE